MHVHTYSNVACGGCGAYTASDYDYMCIILLLIYTGPTIVCG